jgi:hypothetical protein
MTAPRAKHRVPDVARMVRDYYATDGNEAGGYMHIVLDDGNLGDDSIRFCQGECAKAGDAAGVRLADILLEMSPSQRKRLYRSKRR